MIASAAAGYDAGMDALLDLAPAAEHGKHVSPAMLRVELAALEARLAWRLIGAGIAIAGIQAAALFTLLRLVGSGS